jgi:hypothetical protein
MPYALAFTDGTLVAALRDGRLLASADAGESWQTLKTTGIPRVVALAAV